MLPNVKVIIPALNEEASIGKVLDDVPFNLVSEVVVVDNGSIDGTIRVAKSFGVTVLRENRRGYGSACQAGINYLAMKNESIDIVVFLDGDYSDYPKEMEKVLEPILTGKADLVIGSRRKGVSEKGSMTFPQVFGNWLATFLLRIFYGVHFTDLGPFRAIKFESLLGLKLIDNNYGWTVEMQLKAAKKGLKCVEVPVSYRKRIGKSKVSGTVKGTILAGYKILWIIFKYL